jgi:hypothetical protein
MLGMPEYDEYGVEKPEEGCTTKWGNKLAEGTRGDAPWYKQLGLGFAAIPTLLAGHFVDQLSPLNCQGWHVPVPFRSELEETGDQRRYEERHAQGAEGQAQLDADQQRFDEDQEMELRRQHGIYDDPRGSSDQESPYEGMYDHTD